MPLFIRLANCFILRNSYLMFNQMKCSQLLAIVNFRLQWAKRLAASCFGSAHNGDLANMKTHKRKQHQIKTTNGRHDKRF